MAKKFSYNLYEKKHLRNLLKRAEDIDAIFKEAMDEGARIGSSTGYSNPKAPFSFAKHPAARKRIDELMEGLHKNLTLTIEEGNREGWLLSCEKNDKMVDSIVSSTGLPKEQIWQWKQQNLKALEAFQSRKIEGMNLSDRVWKLTDQFKQELELALDIGLGEGKSAAALSRDVRKYLKEPNKLFRRVRDKYGNLQLSKAAKAYHPGQGVYRSSYKNAIRLAGTENNMAYRSADHERWKQMPWVVGIEIKMSNNHPEYDICDELKGVYPADFKYVGWHPHCRCYAVPKQAPMEEFLDYQRKRLDGEDVTGFKFSGVVKDVPDNFKGWLDRNEERVKMHKNVPYFIKDNTKYVPKSWIDGVGSRRKGSDKGIVTDIKEALYKLKEPTYVTEKEVRGMIEKFAKSEPGLFYGGLSGVKISRKQGALMSNGRLHRIDDGSYVKERGNTITIHNYDFKVTSKNGQTSIFNPLHEVKGAMKAISANQPLTFNQEYAIESLWHEIRHAGAVGWKDVRKKTEEFTAAMECINQFCARRSYGKLLNAIGGKVAHKKEIIKNGYGYSETVSRFERVLKAINVSESEAYAHFSKVIMNEPYEDIFNHVVQFLVDKGVDKKSAVTLMNSLRHADAVFNKALTGV